MKKDFIVQDFNAPPHPRGMVLNGITVRLEPLNVEKHSEDLFQSNSLDVEGENWAYLPYRPFDTLKSYQIWLEEAASKQDPTFFSIVRKRDDKAVGLASFLRINQTDGSIEVGHINYSPLLQRTREGTEAMFLMMEWAIENGYRRYEWKCNALNRPSRDAGQRLGMSYEGVFRQAAVVKGHNRDTAWYAVIDQEWPALDKAFQSWLAPDNFDPEGKQRQSLSTLTRPLLVQCG